MLQDIRLALRTLSRQRGFATAALLTLALGIGATTAIFSVVYGVLLRPLPFPDPDRLVQLSEVVPGGTPALPGATWISNLTLYAWEPHRTTLEAIANFSAGTSTVGLDRPRRVGRGVVGAHFFEVLGVQPLRGRFFAEDDALPGAPPTVVLSYEMWRDEFGGDAGALGRTITIDERPHQIIGIAPPGIPLPEPEARFWTPERVTPPTTPDSRDVRVSGTRAVARLAPDATTGQAAAEGTAAARSVARPLAAEMLFGKGGPVEIRVRTLSDQMTGRVRPALVVLFGAVTVLLLIACANVANLFLSRGVSRERDIAVRVAMGAQRGRLVRELLTESVVIAVLGGALGVALAWTLVRALAFSAPANFPRLDAVQLDWRALAVALIASVVAGLLSGAMPAVRGARPDLLTALREGIGASSSRRIAFVRRMLLVAEAALAVLVLIAALLLGRSFINLIRTEAGYDAAGVLTARIYLPGASRSQAQTDGFGDELLARLRALPGIVSAGASNMVPLGQMSAVSGFTMPLPGREAVTARALTYVVTPGYAETLRLRLRKGRLLEDRDRASGVQMMMVNEDFVRTFLSGIEPIGMRFPRIFATGEGSAEIVGVVGNVLKDSLDQQPQAEVYVLAGGGAAIRREINVVLRGTADPSAYAQQVRRVVSELWPDAAVDNVRPLAEQLSQSVAQPRFAATVLGAFAGLALLLAAVGLYGVLSYTVARRQREIGVRSALGASRRRLVGMVLREGLSVAVVGLVVGMASAAALTRLMQTLLVEIQPLDPVSFAAAPMTLLVVALISSAIPARRAAATDPALALRQE